MNPVRAAITPEVIKWARERSHLTLELVAKKMSLSKEKISQWEFGYAQPTIKQLRKLANVYKRPIAIFYLPEPPTGFDVLHDYRKIDPSLLAESPALGLEVRQVYFQREIAMSLYEEDGDNFSKHRFKFSTTSNPESVAGKIREILGVTIEAQLNWKGKYEALNTWRNALENLGVLVFQISGVDINEARGFSISGDKFPVVAVNISDSVRARIFTMLHELVHIFLDKGGLCDLEGKDGEKNIEQFCNAVAGAILVPMQTLESQQEVLNNKGDMRWSSDVLVVLAGKFYVSEETLLRRLLIGGLTSESFYRQKRVEFENYYKELAKQRKAKKRQKSFVPRHKMTISKMGRSFVQSILDNYYEEKITSSDLSDYLGVNLKHLGKIETEIYGGTFRFGALV